VVAIVGALQSPSISRLNVTRRHLQETAKDSLTKLQDLGKLLADVDRYEQYYAALDEGHEPCVPWISELVLTHQGHD
jgi:hypothetical protein